MEKNLTTPSAGRLARPERNIWSIHEAIDRIFNNWMSGLGEEPFPTLMKEGNGLTMPNIDISETEKEIMIAAELPGMDEKDIEVTLNKDRDLLIIKGEKREEKEEKKKDYYRRERHFGSVYREVPLPCDVAADKVIAEFKKGVLNVTLPKTAQAQKETVKIPVKGG